MSLKYPSLLCSLIAILCFQQDASRAQGRFVSPLAGIYGRDYKIINYVDWKADTLFADGHCRSKTYDGHQGTDFAVRSFRVMDSGLDVRAADNGRVIFIRDGVFDREKASVVAKGLGNYVGITHAGKLQTYYAHLRKGSITVKVGDSVVAGQKIALVGSSGNSEGPHLHFELWYDSTYYIDPFSGPCGNATTYWKSEPAYDTGYSSWSSGMCNYVCTLDTLLEEPKRRDTFYAADPAITYWNIQNGLRRGDSLRIDWHTPAGTLWYSYGYRLSRDWWYYMYWSYINTPSSSAEGKWSLKLYRNNIQVATRSFYYFRKPTEVGNTLPLHGSGWTVSYNGERIAVSGGMPGDYFELYDISGKSVRSAHWEGTPCSVATNDLAPGIYVLTCRNNEAPAGRKKVVIY